MENRRRKTGNSDRLYFGGLQNHQRMFKLYKLGLEKAEKPEIKLPTSIGS